MRTTLAIIATFICLHTFSNNLESIHFSYVTKAQGLSDNNVECIFKDSQGFLWFGTRNGLCRYDGYEIKIYRKGNKDTDLSGNRILSICEDMDGYLWVGTYKDGLNKLNKQTEEFVHFGLNKEIGERINSIKVFSDGSIWVASNRGVTSISRKTDSIKIFSYDDGVNSASVHNLLETSKKDIFIASDSDDIQRLNKSTNRFENIKYKRNPNLNSNYRKNLIEDKNGIIWISASYHGLSSYNPANGESENYTAGNNNLSTDVLMGNMAIDPNGDIWICTEEDGINIFNIETKTYKHLKKNKKINGSLNTNHTYSVYFDNENIAWIGTFDKGINVYNPYQKKFKSSLFSPNDLNIIQESSVLDIFEDSKKRVWVGTDGNGLYCFEKNKQPIHFYMGGEIDLLTKNIVTAIGEDPLGNILIGTYSGGFIRYAPEKNEIEKFEIGNSINQVSSPHIWEIYTDSKNKVWLGMLATGADQFLYETGKFRNFGPYSEEKNKIDFQNVMVIMEDSDGDLWFGTEGKGIFVLDNETDRILRIKNDSISDSSTEGVIKCLLQDRWGNVWIGTEDQGLIKYEKRKGLYSKFNTTNGFIDAPVQSLIEDHNGNIWIGTTLGIFKLNTSTNLFSQFIVEDGLSSNDFNPDAMLKLSDGRILAGTNNGVDIIEVDEIHLNPNIPDIVFTKLTVLGKELKPGDIVNGNIILNKSISYTDTIQLTWKDKVFSLEFAAINYTLPQKCQYKYMLEGFDEEWVYTSADRRLATYSNLDAGQYALKVKASNNDAIWGENTKSILVIVKPPFWETIIFKIAMVLLTASAIYLLYRLRIEKQKEIFKQKELEQDKKIISLENEKLESELKKLAFNILNKNKLLLEQKNRIINLSNKAKISVKEGLQKIVEKIDEDMDEQKDWNAIEPQIDNAYNQFISKLRQKHPDLSATEIRIAAYIRMNLSTKDICEFMNKTQRAVENDRYRLRKKIGLETNDSIQNYFLNIEGN